MSYFSKDLPARVNPHQMPVIQGDSAERNTWQAALTIGAMAPLFLEWAQYEMRRAPLTVTRYREALDWIVRDLGDLRVAELHRGHLLALRRKMAVRGCREARIASILNALRSFLRFCEEIARVPALDPREVRVPRVPRRDVVYLTTDEVRRLREAIVGPDEDWQSVPLDRLRFRTIVEVLLGTGARISEVLSLDRSQLIFDRCEAKIIGKGNKERTLCFTSESIDWVRRYLSRRTDSEDALFVSCRYPPRRASVDWVKASFPRIARRAGITKPVSARILRHTMATTLLFNGCPIGHIKELLGHERLDTTCRYYLGLDRREAKKAHQKFLKYDVESSA
jgi:site-specific recombinase XerD